MTFNELIAEVYKLTNRPDLVEETKSAVKAATLKAHMSDFYSKDLYETTVSIAPAAYVSSIDIYSIVNNFRSLSYLRLLDSNSLPTCMVEIISPLELFDAYGYTRSNVAYMAGRVIELKTEVKVSSCIVGCYVLPITTEHNYSSWVADLYPYAIVNEATRVVFKTIGYDEQSAAYDRLTAEQFNLLRSTALADQAF